MIDLILRFLCDWRVKNNDFEKLLASLSRLNFQLEKRNSPWWNLYLGIVNGFGVFIGGVIVVAIFVFILSKLNSVPVIGEYISKIVHIVKQKSG